MALEKNAARPGGKSAKTGQVRIIGGQFRRTVLPVPPVEGLRPSPDRVRETLFNWLGQTLPAIHVLDAFAGTGALGFEAVSRGAAQVDFFEIHPLLCRHLKESAKLLQTRSEATLNLQIYATDVIKALNQVQNAPMFLYDLILLDPPFGSDKLAQAMPLCVSRLAQGGMLYVEWQNSLETDAVLSQLVLSLNLEVYRADRAGQVHFHLLRRADT
ncbi:MAG: 16S rRNA (guanine(966)-N(2))-methyltransferase RsmD [Burkholderiales bacterium]|nr:16S rRNA (guanine(966)-N(2))-methyltransferase RsmD [Burkholderiales bacterium]